MACAVTALPTLVLLMVAWDLATGDGAPNLRDKCLADIVIWVVLAIVVMDWNRVGLQVLFLCLFVLASWAVRRLMAVVSIMLTVPVVTPLPKRHPVLAQRDGRAHRST